MTEHPSTQALVREARSGDRDAFEELARRHRDRLLEAIRSWSKFQVGPPVDAEDVVQESFLRAFGSLGGFEWQDEDAFFRWLCGIARRALAQAIKDSLRAARPDERLQAHSRDPSPSRALGREERFDRLEAALERLSPDHRQAIRLCRIEGLTSAEVARRMKRSPEAVRQLLVRALRDLREAFGDTQSFHLPPRRLKPEGDRDGD